MGHNIIVSAAAAAAAATETKTKVAHIPLNPHPPTRYQYQATPPANHKTPPTCFMAISPLLVTLVALDQSNWIGASVQHGAR